MNMLKAMKLLKKYSNCQECGSEFVGNGEGSLDIGDDYFIRTCKCGWGVEVKENDRGNGRLGKH